MKAPLLATGKIRGSKGFSMIEIMVVIGIMAGLFVIGAPTMGAIFSTSKLSQGASHLQNFLQRAAQIALKENVGVEIRFYRFDDPNTPQKDELFQAYRMFRIKPNDTTSTGAQVELLAEGIEPLQRMPGNCFIADKNNMSTLLSDKVIVGTEENVRGIQPRRRVSADYRGFLIRPDGSVNLPPDAKWFLTVLAKEDFYKKREHAPNNYSCMTVNPSNAGVKIYTP